ncbi:uncharacterized protein ACRADG_012801 [Cochliomyia hominivorax]
MEAVGDNSRPRKNKFIPKPKLKRIPLEFLDFAKYIQDNCENKIQILNRQTFVEITKPLIIVFNHFREKCHYHKKCLDVLYEASLKYSEQIEFIAADIMDIDVIYPEKNPLTFWTKMKRPEEQTPYIYAIDEKKRIYEYLDYNRKRSLEELCEHLLSKKLYPSQPIKENLETDLIKIAVHDNFEEMVLKSSKNIFLIINNEEIEEYEGNYNDLSGDLKDLNLDIVYIEAEKNYIPFEYKVNCYPTIIFIPSQDKKNFVYYEGLESERDFLEKVIKKPEYVKKLLQEQQGPGQRPAIEVAPDFKREFHKLCFFLQEHYRNSLEVLDRAVVEKSKCLIFIAFMDFQKHFTAQHIKWFNELNQLAAISVYKFFVADFKDIDVINSKWLPEDLIKSAQGQPKIYAIDRLNHTYEFGNFSSITSLYYFADQIEHGDLYYSQVYSSDQEHKLIKEWTADAFHNLLYSTNKHLFLTFYSSDDENSEKLMKLLEEISEEVKELNVEVVKFDVKLNYVDLEYAQDRYPVHYFINKNNKQYNKLAENNDFDKNKLMKFIENYVEEND